MVAPDGSKPEKPQLSNFKEKPGMLQHILQWDQAATLWINGSQSLFLDGFFMAITQTVTWLPLIAVLLYVLIRNNDFRHIGLIVLFIGLCILLADQMASGFCKPYFKRFRPTQDPQIMYLLDVVNDYRGGRYGFFSSHAANTFSVAMFVTLLIRRRGLGLMLFSWAALNGWSRIYLGVHYFGDVVVGTVWGCIVGATVYWLYTRLNRQPVRLSVSNRSAFTITNYRLSDADLLTCCFALTYLYVTFNAICFK